MGKTNVYVDKADPASIETLLSLFDAEGTYHEAEIRTALSLHDRPFLLYVDHVNRPTPSPLQDAFTFNMNTDELVVFSDEPAILIDAILEMAMFVHGFNTLMGVDDEWKVQVAIGAWRRVRETLKSQLGLATTPLKLWGADLELENVEHYNMMSFGAAVFMAGRPDVDWNFPPGTSSLLIDAYRRLTHIIEAIALNVDLDDQLVFNRRLNRALTLIEETIMPRNSSPFDDLFGPEGFSDKFFGDSPED